MSNRKYAKKQSITPSECDLESQEEQYKKKNLLLSKWAHELKNIFIVISSLIQNQSEFGIFSERLQQDNTKNNIRSTQISTQQSSKFLSSLCDFGMYLILDITTMNCSNDNGNATAKSKQSHITEFNLSEALDFCIAMFQSKQKFDPKKKHIVIRTAYQFPIDRTIKSISENKFKQVVINLLSNSYKFTLNGEICLSCYFTGQDVLRIQISDTGIGMTPDEQEKLFVPYNKIERSKEINAHGSGLGLFIVKEILNSFGSEVHLHSQKNAGTQFWFDLKEKSEDYNGNNNNINNMNNNNNDNSNSSTNNNTTNNNNAYNNNYNNNDIVILPNDKNVIDPNMMITDSLRNLIMDINEGKKDKMMSQMTFFNYNYNSSTHNDLNAQSNNLNGNCNDVDPEYNDNYIDNNDDKTKLDIITHSNIESELEISALNKSESKYFHNKLNSLSFNRKTEINTQSSSKLITENGELKQVLTQKKLHDSHYESLGDYCRYLSQYPQNLRTHQQLLTKKTRKLNIFICDDEPITALATKNLLSKYFKNDSCNSITPDLVSMSNGIECLYKAYQFICENNPVNIILIDQNMPFLNGIEVCNIMKNMKEMNTIKIYLVTSEEERVKRKVNADGFFSKPLTKDDIREILEKEKIL